MARYSPNRLLALVIVGLLGLSSIPFTVTAGDEPAAGRGTAHNPILINGNSNFATIVQGEGWKGTGTQANPYIIENLDITGTPGYCVRIMYVSAYFIIRNCTFSNTGSGGSYGGASGAIDFYQTTNGLVDNCTVTGTSGWPGIAVRGSSYIWINNTVSTLASQGAGVYTSQSSYVTISYCNLSGNYNSGIRSESSIGVNATGNTIRSGANVAGAIYTITAINIILFNNTIVGGPAGIVLQGSDGGTIKNNTVTGTANIGIEIDTMMMMGSNNIVSGNNVSGNLHYGIFNVFFGGPAPWANQFLNNNCSGNGYTGIGIDRGTSTVVRNNTINGNGQHGFYFGQNSDNVVISGNTITGNGMFGAWVYPIQNCQFDNNTIARNSWDGVYGGFTNSRVCDNSILNNQGGGLYLEYASTNNRIWNNSIYNNSYGINARTGSNGNIICNNTISNNQRGIRLNGSASNVVYNNNFFHNGWQGIDDTATNRWNESYPLCGNYWDDYRGYDYWSGAGQNISGPDGVGEPWYWLEVTGIHPDKYPLMRPAANDLPNSSVNPLPNYWHNKPVKVTANAFDKRDGFGSVSLYYNYSADNATNWTGWKLYAADFDAPWNWVFPYPDGEGYYRFFSLATDYVGNPERPKNTTEAMCAYDGTMPILNITSPLLGQQLNQSSVTTAWTGSDALSGLDRFEFRLDGKDWQSVGLSNGKLLSPVKDGQHSIAVRAFDVAGNVFGAGVDFAVDANAPSIAILYPQEGSVIGTNYTDIDWSGGDLGLGISGFGLALDNGSFLELGLNTTFSFTNLAEGRHTAFVRVNDTLNNTNSTSVTFTVDTGIPSLSITSPLMGALLNVSSVIIEWKGADNNTGTTGYDISYDGMGWMGMGSSTNYLVKGLADGSHSVSVRTRDVAGNTREAIVNFTSDTTAPVLSLLTPADRTLTQSGTVSLTWNASDAVSGVAGYTVIADGAAGVGAGLNTSWQFTGLADGIHILEVRATDRAGNVASARVSVTVDSTAPLLFITAPREGDVIRSPNITATWNGSDSLSGLAGYDILLDGANPRGTGTGTVYVFLALPDGNHTVEVRARDVAGNVRAANVTFTIDTKPQGPFDTTPPRVTATAPSGQKVPLAAQVVITFSEPMNPESLTFTCSPDPGSWKTVWNADRTQAYLLHADFKGKTTYSFTITGGKDPAGNSLNGTAPFSFKTAAPATVSTGTSGGYDATILIGPIIIIVLLGAIAGYLFISRAKGRSPATGAGYQPPRPEPEKDQKKPDADEEFKP